MTTRPLWLRYAIASGKMRARQPSPERTKRQLAEDARYYRMNARELWASANADAT